MIKATVKGFAGSEFKTPKEIFIWFGFRHGDKENIIASLTYHSTALEAKTNQINKTDKGLALMVGITPEFKFSISDLEKFSDFESLKTAIQSEIVGQINILELHHISKLEIC